MTSTISTFDNTTKRASTSVQTSLCGTNRQAEPDFDQYDPNESAHNACARLQREDFRALERVLAAR